MTTELRDPAEPINGACAHCAPYLSKCSHVCGGCGHDVEIGADGAVYADGEPTECVDPSVGFQCSSCGIYTHNECGKGGRCDPCIAWWNGLSAEERAAQEAMVKRPEAA